MEKKFKFGTTQVDLSPELARKINTFAKKVADEDLAGDGRDTGIPHVTLFWGLTTDETGPLRDIVERHFPFYIKFGKTDSFPPSNSSSQAAVLIVRAISPVLANIHKDIAARLPNQPSEHEYTPHCTVAYVKPASISKYAGLDVMDGAEMLATGITFSNREKQKTEITKKK